MEESDFKNIWKAEHDQKNHAKKYTMEDIQQFKSGQSSRTFRAGKRIIWFDVAFKGLLLVALAFLWIMSQTRDERLVAGIPMLVTVILMVWEGSFLKKLPPAHLDETVATHLKKHLNYLRTTFNLFVIFSALSSLLFVITGFLFNFHFKYGTLLGADWLRDPVIYMFLAAAFGLSFGAQKITQKAQIRDVQESLEIIEGSSSEAERIAYLRERRRRNMIIGVLLTLLGILFFLLILLK